MKHLPKFLLLLLFALIINQIQARNVPTAVDELPNGAQIFLKTCFPMPKITQVFKDEGFFRVKYKVILSNGIEIEFNENGDWQDVNGQNREIPTDFIPGKITKYIKEKYPTMTIIRIENNLQNYKVELNGDTNLNFNLNGDFLGMN